MNTRKSYVYALVDPSNHEIRYVGRAYDPKSRYKGHLRGALKLADDGLVGKTYCKHWMRSLLAKELKPILQILEECDGVEQVCLQEDYWIEHYRSQGHRLTNIAKGGLAPMAGRKHTAETKTKMSKSAAGNQNAKGNKGKPHGPMPEETKQKLSEAAKRQWERQKEEGYEPPGHSEGTKQKISESLTGRSLSEEHKKNTSEGLKKAHAEGRVPTGHSEETKQKISESGKGRIPWNRGKQMSEESRKKNSEGQKGKKFSEETKAKLREAQRRRRAREAEEKGSLEPFSEQN